MESSLSISSIALFPDIINPQRRKSKMSEFLTSSIVPRNSFKASKAKELFYHKKIKTQISHDDSIDLPSFQTLDLSRSEIIANSKNTNFIKKKLQDISTSSISKLNKIYRTQLNLTQNSNSKSISRQNLCISVLKKISSKISSNKSSEQRNLFSKGCSAIRVNFSFFGDQINSLTVNRNTTGQKIKKSFDAYAKNENQRILRLVQRQQELEERYSTLKVNLRKKMEKNAQKRLSKRDLYFYSKSLETNRPTSFNFRISKTKPNNP